MQSVEPQILHKEFGQCINNDRNISKDQIESPNESDGPWDSDNELFDDAAYDRMIAENEYSRIRKLYVNIGIKNGIEQVYNRSIQSGFEKGYAVGTEIGARVGKLKGILCALMQIEKIAQISPDVVSPPDAVLPTELSNLVSYRRDLEGCLKKCNDTLTLNAIFASSFDSYGHIKHCETGLLLDPDITKLNSTESHVIDLLYSKCYWPYIPGFGSPPSCSSDIGSEPPS